MDIPININYVQRITNYLSYNFRLFAMIYNQILLKIPYQIFWLYLYPLKIINPFLCEANMFTLLHFLQLIMQVD